MAQPTHTKIGAVPEHRAATRDFLGLMADVARREGWRESDAFTRWMEASACSLANAPLKLLGRREEWDKNEARYMAVVRQSRHQGETMQDMAKALAVVVEALEACPGDFLSPIFGELGAHAGAGQFMTPFALAEMSAQMIMEDPHALLAQARAAGRSWISCQEPCVGMGAMVLAATKVLAGAGINPARQAHWHCTDIDWKAVCGSYIQLSLCGVSAVVFHGDTLALEGWCALPTIMAVMYPKITREPPEPEEAIECVPLPVPGDDTPRQFEFRF